MPRDCCRGRKLPRRCASSWARKLMGAGRKRSENLVDRFGQVTSAGKSAVLGSVRLCRSHQNTTSAESFRRKDITKPVSHPPAAREIDGEALGGLAVEQGTRLPALTRAVHFRKMRTEVMRIEVTTRA